MTAGFKAGFRGCKPPDAADFCSRTADPGARPRTGEGRSPLFGFPTMNNARPWTGPRPCAMMASC